MQDILTDLDYKPALASKTKRWVACLIDYLISLTLSGIVSYVFGTRYTGEDGVSGWELSGFPGFIAIMLPWLLLLPGIETFNNGQTIGKALFRIRTVKEDGARLNFGNSFVKHLFDMIDYLPFLGIVGLIVAANNKQKKRVGDMVAKTIVVDVQK